MTIKYLGSKRRLVPVLAAAASSSEMRTALDLFSGTARVARAFKRTGAAVTAVDSATYAHVLAQAYVATDGDLVDRDELDEAISRLNRLRPVRGYVTDVFCERSRFFHPDNGMRIDAVREEVERRWSGGALYPLLLTSLLEAADRVDSTTGLQMAYLKSWAPRALRPLELRRPELVAGGGRAILGDALEVVPTIGPFDLAYLDPPYNQHRYFTNYHVWETIVRWDAPEHYGVACKRADCRERATGSAFNRRREMPTALAGVISQVNARLVLVSYNDESWLSVDELAAMCQARPGGACLAIVAVDHPRYVGARIGIHNPSGEKVGTVSHVRNSELLFISGPSEEVAAAQEGMLSAAAETRLNARPLLAAVCS